MKQTAVEWLYEKIKSNIDAEDGSMNMNWLHDDTFQQAKEMEKEQQGFSDAEVELIANEMVNWTIDNIGNPNPESGKKFDEVLNKHKNVIG
jgi:hypothetical protein